jgi:hypothetical protein
VFVAQRSPWLGPYPDNPGRAHLRQQIPSDPMDFESELIEVGDVAALCSHIDSLVLDSCWAMIVALRDKCRAALDRGKQLWPAAAWAEYRLCLDAPAFYAAPLVDSTAAKFTLGPFAEVLAASRTWAELAPSLPDTPGAAAVVGECVIRGEDLRADDRAQRLTVGSGLPLFLAPWEPKYPVAIYHLDRVEWDHPDALQSALSTAKKVEVLPGRRIDDPATVRALLDVVAVWTEESNGRAEAVAVEGTAASAIGALGPRSIRMAEVSAQMALATIAWAAGSGGANGRRRGAGAARFETWWVAASLAGLNEDWPLSTDELGAALKDLRWFLWDDGSPETGWHLRLAVESPSEELAWAIAAVDAV